MGKLVIIEREKALTWRERLHRERQRRNIEEDDVAWAAKRCGIAVVGKILEQDRHTLPRLPMELLFMERECILERTGEIWGQIGLDGIDIEKGKILGLKRREVETGCVLRDVVRAFLFRRIGLDRGRRHRLSGWYSLRLGRHRSRRFHD